MNGNVSKEKAGSGNLFVRDGKVYVRDGYAQIELKKAYQTYGVSIDLSNSNPETAVTYINDAVGMSPGSDDWYKMNIFRNIKPCLLQNGTVVGYLNPNNFAQFEDGTAADITSGNGGDVMIEIPKTGYRINKRGTMLTVQITDEPNKEGFSYKAHTRSTEGDRDNLYIGAFLGSVQSSKLRSLSGKQPKSEISIVQARTCAHANAGEGYIGGNGYDQISFYPLTLLQCMYLIQYKNLNSQQALGMGWVSHGLEKTIALTGGTVTKGMNFGETTGLQQMKFLGIEDLWGNLAQWLEGLSLSLNAGATAEDPSELCVSIETNNFGNNFFKKTGVLGQAVIEGYLKEPQGTNTLGFLAETATGSSTTYFSDNIVHHGGDSPHFGGCYNSGIGAGVFNVEIYYLAPVSNDEKIGCRLMYL